MLNLSLWCLQHPKTTILIWILLTALGVYSLKNAKLDSDYRIFFDDDNPQLVAFEQLQALYDKSDTLFIVLTPADGKVFKESSLKAIRETTDRAWRLPYVSRAESVINFPNTRADGDDLIVDDLVPGTLELTERALLGIQKTAVEEPLLVNRLISKKADVAAVMVTFNFPEADLQNEQPEAVKATRALKSEIEARHPDMQIRLVGRVMLNNAIREAALYDMGHLVPLALAIALVFIAAYMFYASGNVLTALFATISSFVIILVSVIGAEGALTALGVHLSSVTVNAPTMILTLAVADSLHILITFFQQLRLGLPRVEAMQESLRLNMEPVWLTSLTTVIGFLCLNFSDAPPFRDLGNTVAVGVALAWLSAITLLPACMNLFPSQAHKSSQEDIELLKKGARWVTQNWQRVLVVTSIMAASAIACLPLNELNDNWVGYFSERLPVRQDFEYVSDKLTGVNTIEFSLSAGKSGDIAEPVYLEKLQNFTDWLESQPEIAHVYSFSHTMKRINKSMHGDDLKWYRLPESRQLAAQYLLLYELSLPYGLDLTNQINMDKSAIRVTGIFHKTRTSEQLSLQRRAQQWLSKHGLPDMWHEGSSTSMMFAHISKRNAISMFEGTLLGMLVIAAILAVVLRSVVYGLLSLITIMLPVLIAFGVWGLIMSEVGIALSVVGGVTLGIVVDYTVHFLSKYKRARVEMGLDTDQGIEYAFGTVGVALIVTTFVLCANFGVLGFSPFAMNSHMGIMTACTIILALIAQLALLPALLMAYRHYLRSTRG